MSDAPQPNSDEWQQIVKEMKRVLSEVEEGHRELQDALSVSPRELRLALRIALIVLRDRRRAKSIAKSTGESESYLRSHLLPILEEVLNDEC